MNALSNVPGTTRSIFPGGHAPIGAILLEAGMLTHEAVDRILELQRREKLRFGEAGIRLGLVADRDVQYALARQFNYAYLPEATEGGPSRELYAAHLPFSEMSEQLRSIRSELMLRWFNRAADQTVLAVVSAARGDGRSLLAANLAVMFAQIGERTLLIDADLRSPRQHELFGLPSATGFSTMLSGRPDDTTIAPIKGFPSLEVIPAGPVPPNPLELLARPGFHHILATARAEYGVVIVDTPALANGADGRMVAVAAGAALAVVRNHHTPLGGFAGLVSGLKQVGVEVVGSVLNDAGE